MKRIACLLLVCCCVVACTAIASDSPSLEPVPDSISTEASPGDMESPAANTVVISLPAFPRIRAAAAASKRKLKAVFHCPKKCEPAPAPAPQPATTIEPTCRRCERLPSVKQYDAEGEVANVVHPCTLREPVITPVANWQLLQHRRANESRPIFGRSPMPEFKPAGREFPTSPMIVAAILFGMIGAVAGVALVVRK